MTPRTVLLILSIANVVTALLPATAVLRSGRSWTEPAGRAALAWVAISGQALVNIVTYSIDLPLSTRLLTNSIGTVLYLSVLLPHTLAWMGRDAKRWTLPTLGLWLAACTVGFATLGSGREFRTIMAPISGIAMCLLTGLALASLVKRAPANLAREDWYWILTGQLLFFTVELFRKPVIEAMVARHWDAITAVSYGISVTYSVCHVIIAWGVLQRAPVTPPRAFAPASLASQV